MIYFIMNYHFYILLYTENISKKIVKTFLYIYMYNRILYTHMYYVKLLSYDNNKLLSYDLCELKKIPRHFSTLFYFFYIFI